MKSFFLLLFFIPLFISSSVSAQWSKIDKKQRLKAPIHNQNKMAVSEGNYDISPILTVHRSPSPLDELFANNKQLNQRAYIPANLNIKTHEKPFAAGNVHQVSYTRLHSVHGYNKAVEQKLNLLTGNLRAMVTEWLGRASKYLPMMIEIIQDKGLPADLVFLPLIESGFKTSAYSRAHAVGQWQFISSTGRRYGLRIDRWVDERRDPEKSTIAAANYLRDNYEMLGSWNLALAGYNCGEHRVAKAVSKAGTKDFWKLRHLLPGETKNYVPIYIAATMIAKDPMRYGFNNVKYQKPFAFDLVMLERPMSLKTVASLAETSVKTLRQLNPELKTDRTPPKVSYYLIRIPEGKRKTFFARMTRLADKNKERKYMAKR